MSFLGKIEKALRDPAAAFRYIKEGRWREKNYVWEERETPLRRKRYASYKEYTKHQKSKLGKIKSTWLPEYDQKYRQILRERLEENGALMRGMGVLCLAARIGTEVKSFLDLGCFAIGIDLNPGPGNKYVVVGDFHHLQFADHSVDVVFTNSLDHSFDLEKIILEVKRVLKPHGILILEIIGGESEGVIPRYYESMSWSSVDVVLTSFTTSGFSIQKRSPFVYPWPGEHVVLRSLDSPR